jgi:hypothetical protein
MCSRLLFLKGNLGEAHCGRPVTRHHNWKKFPVSKSPCLLQLYRNDEPECSELCQCNEGESLSCNTVCVERAPCKTDFAFYNHAAPAYQAYRGRCLCYSGRFICMRPTPGKGTCIKLETAVRKVRVGLSFVWGQVWTHSVSLGGGGADPEAIYNLCLILKVML